MSTVISVESLSKKYVLGHQNQERHATLRDALSSGAKHMAATLRRPFNGSDRGPDPTPEEFWALRDVNFDINQGDRVGIIGRNGAGKSTLLKILSRITEPTKGSIKIKGHVASLLEVGTGFHPELSGRENIYLNGAILGMKRVDIKKRFDEIVAFAEVEKFLDTPVKRYSSGMYVRLAFAVAAHLEPEILIVDEVLAVGDAQFQKKCLGKMRDVGQEGRTVLFVSHNMSALQSLCTKAIRLDQGVAVGQGKVSDEIAKYLAKSDERKLVTHDSRVQCGPDLEILRFEFSPQSLESKKEASCILTLRSTRALTLNSLAVLIYSGVGERVAILDLRDQGGSFKLSEHRSLTVTAQLDSLPLVEGEYNVGLYIDYGIFQGNILDVIDLKVLGPAQESEFAPFPRAVRGVVELNFSLNHSYG